MEDAVEAGCSERHEEKAHNAGGALQSQRLSSDRRGTGKRVGRVDDFRRRGGARRIGGHIAMRGGEHAAGWRGEENVERMVSREHGL